MTRILKGKRIPQARFCSKQCIENTNSYTRVDISGSYYRHRLLHQWARCVNLLKLRS